MNTMKIATATILARVQRAIRENDYDTQGEPVDAERIGLLMRKLRFESVRSPNRRLWRVSLERLAKLAPAYGVALPEALRALHAPVPAEQPPEQSPRPPKDCKD